MHANFPVEGIEGSWKEEKGNPIKTQEVENKK